MTFQLPDLPHSKGSGDQRKTIPLLSSTADNVLSLLHMQIPIRNSVVLLNNSNKQVP
jgi:hypothetical protein